MQWPICYFVQRKLEGILNGCREGVGSQGSHGMQPAKGWASKYQLLPPPCWKNLLAAPEAQLEVGEREERESEKGQGRSGWEKCKAMWETW